MAAKERLPDCDDGRPRRSPSEIHLCFCTPFSALINALMTWFKREKKPLESVEDRRVVTEGLWIKCVGCKEPLWKKDLEAHLQVCPKCNYHYKITANERLNILFDAAWQETDCGLRSTDRLHFKAVKSYKESIDSLRQRSASMRRSLPVSGSWTLHIRS